MCQNGDRQIGEFIEQKLAKIVASLAKSKVKSTYRFFSPAVIEVEVEKYTFW